MKRPFILFLLLTFSQGVFLISCVPDENDPDPNTDPRDKYLGTWMVQESAKKLTYEVEITADPGNSAQVLINNFYNFGIAPYAIATISNLDMPQQAFPAQSIQVWGSGSYSNNKINWTYYVNDGTDILTVTAVYTRN